MLKRLVKKDLNKNLYLGEGNEKLVGTENIAFLIWSITAVKTCPFKTRICEFICYAALEEMRFDNIKNSRARNYEESLKDTFISDMVELLEYNLQRPKYEGKILFIRIHESGDLYNFKYFYKWVTIAEHFKKNKRIVFQAYTKALPYLKEVNLKEINIKFVYSVMDDTDPAHVEEARALGLTTFKAIPIKEKTDKGGTVCPGICGPCVKCYSGRKALNIITKYHGPRAKCKDVI